MKGSDMEQPFLRPPAGADFAANPFAGMPEREGRTMIPESPASAPISQFDLMALLGGPANIAAMQREIEAIPGPLNLETPDGIPAAPAESPPEGANAVSGELPSADQIAAMIALMLDHVVDHVSDRAAFCHKLGQAVSDFIASASGVAGADDAVSSR